MEAEAAQLRAQVGAQAAELEWERTFVESATLAREEEAQRWREEGGRLKEQLEAAEATAVAEAQACTLT